MVRTFTCYSSMRCDVCGGSTRKLMPLFGEEGFRYLPSA